MMGYFMPASWIDEQKNQNPHGFSQKLRLPAGIS
jgi:hypothetical protein